MVSRTGGSGGVSRSAVAGSVVIVMGLVVSACGARVAPYLGAGQGVQAGSGGAAVGSGTGSAGGSGGSSSGGSAGAVGATPGGGAGSVSGSGSSSSGSSSSGSSGGGTASAAGTTGGVAALTPDNFVYQPAQQAAYCQGTAGNTASAPGITPTTITLGNVSGITGVLANNFGQGPQAVQALFSAVNAAGGICGRQLKLLVEDDGQDAGHNASDIADEIPKVFAFVGSTSDADNGGVQEMQNAGTPDFGAAINPNRGVSPVYWSPNGATVFTQNGHPYIYNTLANGLKQAGNFPTKVALLAYSVPISASAAQEFQNMFSQSGASVCFTDYSISPASTSLDQDVLEMKSKGCNGVFTTLDVTGNAKLLQAINRQAWKPTFAGTTFDGYTPALISVAGSSNAQGFEMNLPFLPFNDNNPIVNQYESQLSTYEPGQSPSGFGIEAWASGQMFLYALIKAGRNPTRTSLTNVLNAIQTWDTGGATVPITPKLRHPAGPCTMAVAIKGNDFVRVWPASGFYCNGTFIRVG